MLVDDVVKSTDKLKSMGKGQGHGEVKYFSELLLLAEYTSTHRRLGVEVSSNGLSCADVQCS